MINKTLYTPPVVEVLPIRMEGPLCTSAETSGLPDYDLVTGTITWD